MALDRYGKIWNSHRFSLEDLPRVQDVLRSCDQDILVKTLVDQRVSAFIPGKDSLARSMMDASVRVSLESLCELELDKESCGLVFVPKASYVLNTRKLVLSRFVDAVLVPTDGLLTVSRYRAAMGGKVKTFSQAERSLAEASHALREEGRDCSPEGIPFAFHASEDVLACHVWIPSGWCAFERYLFLAMIVWEHLYSSPDSLVGFLSQHAMKNQSADVPVGDVCAHPDQLHVTYRQKMADVTGALNHNAFLDCLDDQIELGSRLGLIA